MGSFLSGCVTQIICCCMSESVSSCSKALGTSISTKLFYSIILLLMSIVVYILGNLSQWTKDSSWISWIISFQNCPEDICFGTMATYRVTSATTVFHFLLAILLIGVKRKSDFRTILQDGLWAIKLLILVGITVGFFFIPNEPFLYYGYASLGGSALFIVFQLVLLVDFAHSLSESLVGRYEDSHQKFWFVALIGSAVVLYIAALVLTVLMLVFFCENQRVCWTNSMFITLNLIFAIFYSGLSILPKVQDKNPRSGLLQSAVVTAFCTYLVFSSLVSEPADMGCSSLSFTFGKSTSVISTVVGVIITFLAIIYSALKTSNGDIPSETSSLLSKSIPKRPDTTDPEDDDRKPSDPFEDDMVPYNYSFFHISFCLASQYLCMVLTNWAVVSNEGTSKLSVDQGMAAVWIKIVSSWVTIALYIWTIIAPLVLPNRSFT